MQGLFQYSGKRKGEELRSVCGLQGEGESIVREDKKRKEERKGKLSWRVPREARGRFLVKAVLTSLVAQRRAQPSSLAEEASHRLPGR